MCVGALDGDLAGGVTDLRLHDAEAVDAGHLGGRLAAAQPREEPPHLVGQVV